MPKVSKKIRAPALASSARHDPLGQVIQKDVDSQKFASTGRRNKRRTAKGEEEDGGGDALLDSKTSQRILEMSKAQQLEVVAEEDTRRHRAQQYSVEHDDSDDDHVPNDALGEAEDDEDDWVEEDQGYVTVVERDSMGLSAEDEALIASMMNPSEERRTLADIILEKIHEKEAEKRGELQHDSHQPELPPKVVEVYTDIGKILSRYTSGKLPKAFKVIPSLVNWEEVLYLTRPDMWTPQAMYAATRIFASNLNPKLAQRFYNLVLLDSVRADIHMNKKLNYHYFMSLKKSIYKPSAFFKGILLPLAKDDCTLREAVIVASVLQRVSIPVHHAAVAIHKLAQQREYNGASSIFIKTLLNKKYSLPAPVISSLVHHFSSFLDDERALPVLWHQALLVFVQRYKNEVQNESREALRLVMKKHFHHKITPEIRRELFGAQAWSDERKKLQSPGDSMELE